MFLGDSITQGWGDTMRGSFEDMQVANRGISGDTTRGMLFRLQEDVLSLQPRAVVIQLRRMDGEHKICTGEQLVSLMGFLMVLST